MTSHVARMAVSGNIYKILLESLWGGGESKYECKWEWIHYDIC